LNIFLIIKKKIHAAQREPLDISRESIIVVIVDDEEFQLDLRIKGRNLSLMAHILSQVTFVIL